jgi:hypothetical protein
MLDGGVGIITVERGIGERQLIQARYFESRVGKATLLGATAGGLDLARRDVDADYSPGATNSATSAVMEPWLEPSEALLVERMAL